MKKISGTIKIILLSFFCFFILPLLSSCDPDDAPTPPVVTDPASVTDIDGNVYTVIRIGTQLWTVENLRTTRYKDGTSIANGLDDAAWASNTAGAYAIYGDIAANNTTYGKLYNWYAASSGKLAPDGWHVPTRAEWEILIEYLGGSTNAGGKMKSTSALWQAPNLGADNSSGFTALPNGYKAYLSGDYELIGEAAYFWASTAANASQGRYVRLDDELAGIAGNGANNTFGYAVRCVKD